MTSPRLRLTLPAALVCGALLALAPGVGARTVTLSYGPAIRARSNVVSDGRRWAAFTTTTGATRVLDTKRHTAYVVRTPAGCGQTPDGEGGIVGLGGGQLAWSCGGALLDLAKRHVHEAPPTGTFGRCDGGTTITGVGSNWIALGCFGNHIRIPLYANWRTGAVREEPKDPRHIADLNRPGLERTLCSPLRRPPNPELDPVGTESVAQFEPSYATNGPVASWSTNDLTGDIFIQRCGQARKVRRAAFIPPGSRWLVSSEAHKLRITSLTTNRTLVFNAPAGYGVGTATDSRLFLVHEHRSDSNPANTYWTTRIATIPRG